MVQHACHPRNGEDRQEDPRDSLWAILTKSLNPGPVRDSTFKKKIKVGIFLRNNTQDSTQALYMLVHIHKDICTHIHTYSSTH